MSVQPVGPNQVIQEPKKVYHVSNSEVATWLACQRKYYYNFDLNLAPKKYGPSLSRGLAGHAVLEVYYTCRKNGLSHEQSVAHAENKLAELMREGVFELEILIDVDRILKRYWIFISNDNWEILAVEAHHAIDLTDEYDYTMRMDIVARINQELMVVDHKFVYDFYSVDSINNTMPQLPKYVASLQVSGAQVNRAMLNMLRWRMLKTRVMLDEELFKRVTITPPPAVLRQHMREQILSSRDIIEHRKLSIEERERSVRRNMSVMGCRSCSFNSLCIAQMYGTDIQVDIEVNYMQNTYGYNGGDELN